MKIEKVKKLVASLREKTEFVIPIRYLKQALKHALVLTKAHKMLEINQNASLKQYIDMSKHLKNSKKWFWKQIF